MHIELLASVVVSLHYDHIVTILNYPTFATSVK